MTEFVKTKRGYHTFTHGSWEVRIWPSGHKWTRIQVISPNHGEEIEVMEEGICVNGESLGVQKEPGHVAFTIPWPVIAAIGTACQIVMKD